MQLPDDPAVLVLLVVTDGARWLPETLRGLRAQQHRPLKVIAVDNASSDGSREMLTKAFGTRRVVTLERRVGYGRALAAGLKVAAERSTNADAFLLLHDDTALQPGAIEGMVETLRGEGTGIVGCKLVDWERPELLQDIGRTTDRYGRQVPRVERGELDQGQHEDTVDVLYASSAALLVAREVVEKVGLFDARYVVLRDDLDLCWRARLAGYRTVVTTTASARHARAGEREMREAPPRGRARYYADRNMIATLIKNYSIVRLFLALPVTILVSLWNVLLFLLTGRRRQALQVLEALQWNVVHLPSTLRARVRAQHGRVVSDASVAALMHHGATRLRAQFERAFESVIGTPEEITEEEIEAEPPPVVRRIAGHPTAIGVLLAVILIAIGTRGLWGGGHLAGADLAAFPDGPRGFFAEYASGWRGTAEGGGGAATPAQFLLGLLTLASGGSGWLAQRVLLLGLPVLAGVMMARMGRTLGLPVVVRRGAGVVYALSPLVLGAYGAGRVSDLVLFASAPMLVVSLLRAGSILPRGGWRALAAGIIGLALTAAFAPWVLPLVAVSGLILAVVAVTRRAGAWPVLRRTGMMVAGALALLFPWSIELFRPGSPVGAGPAGPGATMPDLLTLSAASVRPVPLALGFGIAVAAIGGVLMARGRLRVVASALAVLAFAGLIAAWLVARGVPWIAPRPSMPLAITAVAFVTLGAIGAAAVGPLLRARSVGRLHIATVVAGVLVLAQLVPAAAWFARGDREGVIEAGALVPAFFEQEAIDRGAFRVLWVGGTAREPVVALTGHEGATMAGFLARPGGRGADVVRTVAGAIAGGATTAGGRALATLGVRFVIVRPEAHSSIAEAFASQGDLAFSQRFRDAAIYRVTTDLPIATTLAADGWVEAARSDDLAQVAIAEPAPGLGPGFRRISGSSYEGEVGPNAVELLLAEDFSRGWRAQAEGATLEAQESFGWATRFTLGEAAGTIRIEWTGQRWYRAGLLVQVLILVVFAGWWSQRAAQDRGER